MRRFLYITICICIYILGCFTGKFFCMRKIAGHKYKIDFVYEGEISNTSQKIGSKDANTKEAVEDDGHSGLGRQFVDNGLITTPYMAASIADIVFSQVYGVEDTRKQKPFKVKFKDNKYWLIEGQRQYGHGEKGGTPFMVLNKADGRILYLIHSK